MIVLTTILGSLAGGIMGYYIVYCFLVWWWGEDDGWIVPLLSFYVGIPVGLACGAITGCLVGVRLSRHYYSGADLPTFLGSLAGALIGFLIVYCTAVLHGEDKREAVCTALLYGVPIGLACGAIIGFTVGVKLSRR